jgi:hypothetical protein
MRGVFMGDIVFTDDAAFVFTAPGPVTHTVDITGGSWFASALHLWLYLLSQANTAFSTSYTVTLDETTRVLTFTGSPVCDVPDVDGIGFAAGVGTTLTTSAALAGVFSPVWPIISLNYGVDNLTGYSAAAQDGSTYTLAGAWQETCNVRMFIDRTNGTWSEYTAWQYMWHTYWLQGRFVVLYIDSDDLPTTAAGTITPGVLLQYAVGAVDTKPVHMFNRLVENADRRDSTDDIRFHVKRNNTAAWTIRT